MMRLPLKSSCALLMVCASLAPASSAEEPMKVDLVRGTNWQNHHFAMSNWFYEYKPHDPAAQIAILAERGYDGVMLSLKDDPDQWAMLPAYLAALKEHNLRLTAIHARFYIEDGTYPQVIKDHLPMLRDTQVVLIPSVGSRKGLGRDDPQALEMTVKILREMSDDAKVYGLGGVAPYMHIGNWIETIDDNLRVARAVDRRNVGVMFHLHHWQAIGNRDMDKLRADLTKAKPYLMVVVVQGTDHDQVTHKILGEGSFDMVALVRILREIDYQGPLGTMGYTQRGDIPDKLGRAFRAWKKIKAAAE
jgi:sugar phosphate isomerase/epimerase